MKTKYIRLWKNIPSPRFFGVCVGLISLLAFFWIMQEFSLRTQLCQRDPALRLIGIRELVNNPDFVAGFIPELVRNLERDSDFDLPFCQILLCRLGHEAVSALVETTQHKNAHMRRYAIGAFGHPSLAFGRGFRPEDDAYIYPRIVHVMLHDESMEVRAEAAKALCFVAKGANRRLEAAKDLVKTVNLPNRLVKLNALISIGLIARDHVADLDFTAPILSHFLEDEELSVKGGALFALEECDIDDWRSVAAIVYMVTYGAAELHGNAMRGFEQLRRSREKTISLLLCELHGCKQDDSRCNLLRGLSWLSPLPVDCAQQLMEDLEQSKSDESLRLHIKLIAEIHPPAAEAVPVLRTQLLNSSLAIRLSAAWGLTQMSQTNSAVVDALISCLDSPDEVTRVGAISTIIDIGSAAPQQGRRSHCSNAYVIRIHVRMHAFLQLQRFRRLGTINVTVHRSR